MATTVNQTKIDTVQSATLAGYETAMNTALAAFNGSSNPLNAAGGKVLLNVTTIHDGTNFNGIITYSEFAIPS